MTKFILKLANILLLLLLFSCNNKAEQEALKDILDAQLALTKEYADIETSPLTPKDLVTFKSLDFFPPNLDFRVLATFVKNPSPVPFEMSTSTDRKPIYQKYGTLTFEIYSKTYSLPVYQNVDFMKKGAYENYLFVPFTDLTNGEETYGGGRYLDLELPLADKVLLDFNKSYNPYCAYNHKYSCVIPPRESRLEVKINAGVKKFHD